jgi:hypothetical protein
MKSNNIFLSNSDNGGGIAFNVFKLAEEFTLKHRMARVLILNDGFLKCLRNIIKADGDTYLYSTSAKCLMLSCMAYLFRLTLRKKTFIAQIVYHPRFCDPSVSLFRRMIRAALSILPDSNVYYYCDEAVRASKIKKIEDVNSTNIVGLCSMVNAVEDVSPPENIRLAIENHSLHICTIGRLVDFKLGSILSLIDYAKQNQSVLLTIIGYGPLESTIIKKVKNQSNILFLGQRTISETKAIIKCCDLYVGMGTTLVDAATLNKKAIVAIESSDKGLTTGFFGEEEGIHYGEYRSGYDYYDLKDFLSRFAFENKFVKLNNLKSPWTKLIDSQSILKKSTKLDTIIILFLLSLSMLVRPFTKNDYH